MNGEKEKLAGDLSTQSIFTSEPSNLKQSVISLVNAVNDTIKIETIPNEFRSAFRLHNQIMTILGEYDSIYDSLGYCRELSIQRTYEKHIKHLTNKSNSAKEVATPRVEEALVEETKWQNEIKRLNQQVNDLKMSKLMTDRAINEAKKHYQDIKAELNLVYEELAAKNIKYEARRKNCRCGLFKDENPPESGMEDSPTSDYTTSLLPEKHRWNTSTASNLLELKHLKSVFYPESPSVSLVPPAPKRLHNVTHTTELRRKAKIQKGTELVLKLEEFKEIMTKSPNNISSNLIEQLTQLTRNYCNLLQGKDRTDCKRTQGVDRHEAQLTPNDVSSNFNNPKHYRPRSIHNKESFFITQKPGRFNQ